MPDNELVERVARAINSAFNESVDISEPLRQEEAELLARAAITEHRNAMSEGVGELVEDLRAYSRGAALAHMDTAAVDKAADALTALQARLAEVTGLAKIGREHLQAGNIDDALTAFNRIALSPSEEQTSPRTP